MNCNLKSILWIGVILNVFFPKIQAQTTTFENLQTFISKYPEVKTIYIKNGVYRDVNIALSRLEGISIQAEDAGRVILQGKANINIRNSRNVILSGFHFQKTWSQYLIKLEKISNSVIKECFFDHCEGNAYSRVIGLQGGSTHNKILNNTFDGIHTMGITISRDGNYYNTISKNVFLNIPRVKAVHPESKDGNGMETISIGTIPYWDEDMEKQEFNTTVSYNYFENIEGDMNEVICVKANKNFIENNYFTKNKGGISLRYGNNNVVKSNIFVENSQNIIVWGKGHQISENIIYNDKLGIQLPSSHFKNTRKNIKNNKAGFFQAENIVIKDNFIFTLDGNPFFVGRHYSKDREFLPTNILIKNNQLKIESKEANQHMSKLRKAKLENNSSVLIWDNLETKIKPNKYYYGKSW